MKSITSHSSRLKPFLRALVRSFLISPVLLALGCAEMTYNKLLDQAQAENREYVDQYRATCAIAMPFSAIRFYADSPQVGFWDSRYRGGSYMCYAPNGASEAHAELIRHCEADHSQECIVAFERPYGTETYLFYGPAIEARNAQLVHQANIAAQQQAAARERDTLTRRQAQCRQYGFQNNSDSLAQCVMQLAIAEEAQASQAASAAESARLQAAILEQAEEARRMQGFAQSMQTMQMGVDIASGRMPASPPITSPNPATGGMYKTCTYRVGNQLLPITVSSVSLCQTTANFNGVTGFLVQ
jgi:hypothetical protein